MHISHNYVHIYDVVPFRQLPTHKAPIVLFKYARIAYSNSVKIQGAQLSLRDPRDALCKLKRTLSYQLL